MQTHTHTHTYTHRPRTHTHTHVRTYTHYTRIHFLTFTKGQSVNLPLKCVIILKCNEHSTAFVSNTYPERTAFELLKQIRKEFMDKEEARTP